MSTVTTKRASADSGRLHRMPGCRCALFFGDDERPDYRAVMVDERAWTSPDRHDLRQQTLQTVNVQILPLAPFEALRSSAADAGVPFVSHHESRWNDRGEPIGPILETRV